MASISASGRQPTKPTADGMWFGLLLLLLLLLLAVGCRLWKWIVPPFEMR